MGTIKKEYIDKKFASSINELVDPKTGEIFDLKKSNLIIRKETGNFSINSSSYVYLDTLKLSILIKNGIKQVDLALLITLSSNLHYYNNAGYNICMDDDNPHTTKSIGLLINNSPQATKNKLNNLIDLGLLYHGEIKEKKGWGKVYVVNPHLVRKGKSVKKYLGEIFNDIY
jgi:predicted transcriptional regulator